jgi:hypothetical protein
MRIVLAGTLVFAAFGLIGCGGSGDGLVPVTGTVTVDGQPGDGAAVAFVPKDGTPGNGGTALADASGKYEITTPQGKKGLAPGAYKVTVSYRRNPDGSAPDPNTPPIEAKAVEWLPPKFSDRDKTELSATVAADAKSHDFTVQTGKKK